MKLVPMIGSPPMPMQVDWPMPRCGQLADGFVGQGAGARDDADGAGLVNVARHDADLALAGRDDAGAVGADEARVRLRLQVLPGVDHVEGRNAFGDADDEGEAGVGRFHDGVGGEGRAVRRSRRRWRRCPSRRRPRC